MYILLKSFKLSTTWPVMKLYDIMLCYQYVIDIILIKYLFKNGLGSHVIVSGL